MDIITCKAKSSDGNWVYGYPIKYLDGSIAIFCSETSLMIPVVAHTLCYSTGMPDKNGRELFIGDTINDFGGGVSEIDYDHPSYHNSMAYPPRKVVGDTTRLGNIVMEDGTVRIETHEMSYCYNISSSSSLSNMEYVSNVWDQLP